MLNRILFAVLVLGCFACGKDDTNSFVDGVVPEISLVEVKPSGNIVAYQDSLVFTILFKDGDGDIGFSNPDIPAVFVVDNRDPNALIFEFPLSPRAPEGSTIAIQGELDIVLSNTILLDDGNDMETTTFSITIIDVAGNGSNEVQTPELTIVRE